MNYVYYLTSFNDLKQKVKNNENDYYERDFYALIDEINAELPQITERVFNHPKYNFMPTKEVPESLLLNNLEILIEDIDTYVKKRRIQF
ncbi:hypothetical protein WH52_07225 [Tenacibaculum holothuriorum]|uniref:HEPN domain-containing protein n=1 Tax=Tenacibaculum holothuriorum TaxID=1635173 RepID=A0A1Y2PEU6_9FLAO|nr:hypothetical protein [Tenacibaculum holothuriorum]OSY88531.1 hypothetical protein WH52_07225 [Tenacibaculum holothuriorum]